MHFIILTVAVASIVLFDINITIIITITINLEKESRKSEKIARYGTYVYYLLLQILGKEILLKVLLCTHMTGFLEYVLRKSVQAPPFGIQSYSCYVMASS